MNASARTEWHSRLEIDGIAHAALLAASVGLIVLAMLAASADASPCPRQAGVTDRAAA